MLARVVTADQRRRTGCAEPKRPGVSGFNVGLGLAVRLPQAQADRDSASLLGVLPLDADGRVVSDLQLTGTLVMRTPCKLIRRQNLRPHARPMAVCFMPMVSLPPSPPGGMMAGELNSDGPVTVLRGATMKAAVISLAASSAQVKPAV